jgi:fructokinase
MAMAPAGAPLIVSFGEALWDLVPGGPLLGGAPLNFVYRCTNLGALGAMVSRLGTDELGLRAEEQMRGLGLDMRWMQRDAGRPTGTVNVSLDAKGIPDFTIVPDVAYDYIALEPGLEALAARATCLCFGTLAQRGPVSRATLARLLECFRGRFRLLDINLRRDCYTADSIRASVERADILKMNETEAPVVARCCGVGEGPLPLVARGILERMRLAHCVLTLGEGGCFAVSRGGESVYEPAYRVELVDTIGSGDAFTAAFLCGLLRGDGLRAACRAGNALGALVAAQPGATQRVDPADLARFAASGARALEDGRFAATPR